MQCKLQAIEDQVKAIAWNEQSSQSRLMNTIITEDLSFSSSFTSTSTLFSNNRINKPSTIPKVHYIQSILDDDTVESTQEKNRLKEDLKKQAVENARLKMELKEKGQTLKSCQDYLANIGATRND